MQKGCKNLNYHWRPCDVQALQKALLQVKLSDEVASDNVSLNVIESLRNYLGLLPKRSQ